MQSWAEALKKAHIYQISWFWGSVEPHTWENRTGFASAVIQNIQLKSPLHGKQISVYNTKQKDVSSLHACLKW